MNEHDAVEAVNAIDTVVSAFLADVPETTEPSRPPRITKAKLTNVHHLKHGIGERYKELTTLAGSIGYHESNAREAAQTVYLLIDDTTDDGADVDPMLAQAYQALTRAAQLLFEAQTHMYRYVNKLENVRQMNEEFAAELMAEHGNP